MRKTLAFLLALLAGPAFAQQVPPDAARIVSPAQLLGQARFTWLGIHIYDANLWSNAAPFAWSSPLALQLTYAMGIDGDDLLDTTMKEITRIEGASADLPQLKQVLAKCMGTVAEGDSYTAASASADRLTMWLNGTQTCDVTYPGVKQRFLGIWLADNSRSPDLSRQLCGS
jgi:hypothetical protein